MERQQRRGRSAGLLVALLFLCFILGTAFGAVAATVRTAPRSAVTTATDPTEATETVPTEAPTESTTPEATVTLYDVPLDTELQLHIILTAEAYAIDPAVAIAVIWKESTYKAGAVGDSGNSLGLMQIQPRWHEARMERLGCPDLLDPFQNVTVGVDILAGLIDKYDGNISMALMAYNAGDGGAYRYWFSQGIYSNDYSKAVLGKVAELVTYETTI